MATARHAPMAAPIAMATLFVLWTIGAALRVKVERGVGDEVVVDVERIESGILIVALDMACLKDRRWVDELIYPKPSLEYRKRQLTSSWTAKGGP